MEDYFNKEVGEPVSPTGQYLNSSTLSVSIIGVWEFEAPIDDSQTLSLVKDVFLPINPRFSSVMVASNKGKKYWKRVEVNPEDHIKVPVFPSGMEPDFYDNYLQNYLSDIAMEEFPQDRPLWEIHIIKYPTRNAAGNLIFKLHHSIGDGFSLMGALLSCVKRTDNPSLPLTFPTIGLNVKHDNNVLRRVPGLCSLAFNTVSDFCSSLMKGTFVKDHRTPIRSGNEGVEFLPVTVSTMAFSLHDLKQIKSNLGVTVNDVITGVIMYGTRLYMEKQSKGSAKISNATALVLLNTRMFRSYKSAQEMVKPEAEARWGNLFAFLPVSIPKLSFSDPLQFVREAHKIIIRKRRSAAVYLTGRLLEILRKSLGPEAAAKFVHRTLKNTSMAISNVMGPLQQVALANQPLKGIYFFVVGAPQSISFGVVSYMGTLRVAVATEKNFIDSPSFKSSIESSFDIIFKAACGSGCSSQPAAL